MFGAGKKRPSSDQAAAGDQADDPAGDQPEEPGESGEDGFGVDSDLFAAWQEANEVVSRLIFRYTINTDLC